MHTGSHKLNNALGQALLARRMGKTRIIAETGAGQHGVASATVCALLGVECVVYMGAEDIRRQQPNVQRMELLGARVVSVEAGARTLKEAVSEAIRDWVTNVADTHYIIGSAVGPAPYPAIVRDLQRVIGDEARAQLARAHGQAARPRDRVRRRRLELDRDVRRLRRRRRASSSSASRRRARASRPAATARRSPSAAAPASCTARSRRSCRTTRARSARRTRSRPGLDYPGSGPEHAWLRDSGPRALRRRQRRRRARDVPPRHAARGDHPGARDLPRAALRAPAGRERGSTSSAARGGATRTSPRCSRSRDCASLLDRRRWRLPAGALAMSTVPAANAGVERIAAPSRARASARR